MVLWNLGVYLVFDIEINEYDVHILTLNLEEKCLKSELNWEF